MKVACKIQITTPSNGELLSGYVSEQRQPADTQDEHLLAALLFVDYFG